MNKDVQATALPTGFTPPHLISGMSESSPILAAFSGGADSSALLLMLSAYSKQSGAKIYAAHVNHMLRGEEADRDEQFCRETARKLGIELFVCKRDVRAFAEESSQSIETAARQVRYEFFDSIMREHSIPLLATAHNANDNLETMLFNMTRGCGLGGMRGIPLSRRSKEGWVIRPILGMSRKDILRFCEENGLRFVTDSTNTDTLYTRNKIRAEVIPLLEQINENVVENAFRLSQTLYKDHACLESMTDMFLEQLGEDASINSELVALSPEAITSRALLAMYKDVSGGASLETSHLESIRQLCRASIPHSRIHLPRSIEARIENGRLYIEKRCPPPAPAEPFEQVLHMGKNSISQINAEIIIENSQSNINIYKNSILLYLDSAKICGELVARERRAGDRIRLGGMSKSIKKLLCDKKIPLEIRYRLPVICDSNGIVAVPMLGAADGAKAKKDGASLILRMDLI